MAKRQAAKAIMGLWKKIAVINDVIHKNYLQGKRIAARYHWNRHGFDKMEAARADGYTHGMLVAEVLEQYAADYEIVPIQLHDNCWDAGDFRQTFVQRTIRRGMKSVCGFCAYHKIFLAAARQENTTAKQQLGGTGDDSISQPYSKPAVCGRFSADRRAAQRGGVPLSIGRRLEISARTDADNARHCTGHLLYRYFFA